MMNYVYSKRSKEQHASSCHAHARQRGSNGGSTSHPRPDTLYVYLTVGAQCAPAKT